MLSDTRLFDLLRLLMFLAGALLFGVSLLFEVLVFTSIAGGAILGFSLAAGLELTKIVSILAAPISVTTSRLGIILRSVSLISLRFGLFCISAFCSGAFLAMHIDQPNILAVRAQDQKKIEQNHANELRERLRHLEKQRNADVAELQAHRTRERDRLKQHHEPEIRLLGALLTQEMDIQVNGDFIGPRYRELKSRREQHKRIYSNAINELEEEITASIAARRQTGEERITAARIFANESLNSSITAIRMHDYENDQRVSLPVIYAARRAIQQVSGTTTNDLRVGVIFAVLLSVVIEVGIFCIFSQYSDVISRVLVAQSQIWKSRQLAIENAVQNIDEFQQHKENEQNRVNQARRDAEHRMRQRFVSALKTTAPS